MEKRSDVILQLVFVTGLLLVLLMIYFTRIAPSRAGEEVAKTYQDNVAMQYADLQNVYQFEQEERRLLTRIELLRADYAAAVIDYRQEREKIELSGQLSSLEKRERMAALEKIYSQSYFDRKMELIEQEQSLLDRLRQLKCDKFCSYEDLPDAE
jgi:hypothetical protein